MWPNDPSNAADNDLRMEVWQNNIALNNTQVNVHGPGLTYEVKNSVPGWKVDAATSYFANTDAKNAMNYKIYVTASGGQLSDCPPQQVTAYTLTRAPAIANEGAGVYSGRYATHLYAL